MMNKETLENILPATGKARRGKLFLSKNCFSPENALTLYQYLKLSLLDVNHWNRHKSGISIKPTLVDLCGRQVDRIARTGDRLKIILPRWQSFLRKEDWFEVRRVEERLNGNTEIFFITIVPSVDPEADLSFAPAFSKRESSVTIFVIRDEHKVELQIHTRERRMNCQGATINFRLETIVHSLFTLSRFYKRQCGKLLKSLLTEGSLNFTNLN